MSCAHLESFLLVKRNLICYCNLYSYFVKPANRRARVYKAYYCLCSVCNEHSPRLHACLFCVFFGCFDTGHIQDHAQNEKHLLALDVNHGHIFCFECGDYFYSSVIFKLTEPLKIKFDEELSKTGLYTKYTPSYADLELISLLEKRRHYRDDLFIGLRGLFNLGSTCFMNSIVQALMHTPFLRNYFLMEYHDCCEKENCVACEMSYLFQEFYSGQKPPLLLNRLLIMIWKEARHMAGYAQQDAQEFFISTLNILHRQCQPPDRKPPDLHSAKCNCIIDQVFTGRLRSDVICQACKNVSTTIEPFWDISLDVGTDPHTLIDCLERYTRSEQITEKIKCSNCDSYQESTKQMTMKDLPLVASFHFKRFEHSSKKRKKITTEIAFPAELDMTPFLSHVRNDPSPKPSRDNMYSLYAVTNHMGHLDNGHYIAYVRQQKGRWYECDDSIIKKASLTDVLNSEGYQLFYHKQTINYDKSGF